MLFFGVKSFIFRVKSLISSICSIKSCIFTTDIRFFKVKLKPNLQNKKLNFTQLIRPYFQGKNQAPLFTITNLIFRVLYNLSFKVNCLSFVLKSRFLQLLAYSIGNCLSVREKSLNFAVQGLICRLNYLIIRVKYVLFTDFKVSLGYNKAKVECVWFSIHITQITKLENGNNETWKGHPFFHKKWWLKQQKIEI